MSLTGNLESFQLASILQLLHADRKTGALQVREGERWVNVIFQEGSIVYAMASHQHYRLGNLLLARGAITTQQLEQCLAEGKENKQALGKVLVNHNYISIDQLNEFIHNQVEEILYSLFFWETGSFEYRNARLNLSGMVVTRLEVMEIMLEASRRIDEMSVLTKQINSGDMVFLKSSHTEDDRDLILISYEWNVLELIDGERTVHRLVEESGGDKFNVYKALYSLASSGLIRQSKENTPPAPAPLSDSVSGSDSDSVEPTPKTGTEDYSAIISAYHNIFQIIWQNLEPEIGNAAPVLFEESKPEAIPGQKALFDEFHPGSPAPSNVYTIAGNLKTIPGLTNERMFLVESLNRYVLNLLNQVPELLGFATTRTMLVDIEKIIPFLSKYVKDLNINSPIIEDIQKIMTRIKQQINKPAGNKSGGVLSMFKKKK